VRWTPLLLLLVHGNWVLVSNVLWEGVVVVVVVADLFLSLGPIVDAVAEVAEVVEVVEVEVERLQQLAVALS